MNLALFILREFFEMMWGLKKLFSSLIDGDPLDNGPNSCACRRYAAAFAERSTDRLDLYMSGIGPARSTWTETVTVRIGCRCSSVTSIRISSGAALFILSNRSR